MMTRTSLEITVAILRKRRRLALYFAVFGLVIAVAFGLYSGIDPRGDTAAALWLGIVSFVLCPGSLLFVTFIDAEPWTNGFFLMWFVIGLINFGLYGAIGYVIGKGLWKSGLISTTVAEQFKENARQHLHV